MATTFNRQWHMARTRAQTWKTILVIALILFAVGILFSGAIIWYVAILFILLAMAGGALLYRNLGPPTR